MQDVITYCLGIAETIDFSSIPMSISEEYGDNFRFNSYYQWGLIELAHKLMDSKESDPYLVINEFISTMECAQYYDEFINRETAVIWYSALMAGEDVKEALDNGYIC